MSRKVSWVQVLIVLIGTLLGSMLSTVTKDVSFLSWLSFGDSFALSPFTVNLGVFHLTFGFGVDVCIGMLLGMIISMVIARKVR